MQFPQGEFCIIGDLENSMSVNISPRTTNEPYVGMKMHWFRPIHPIPERSAIARSYIRESST
jgi:hypothetical protein